LLTKLALLGTLATSACTSPLGEAELRGLGQPQALAAEAPTLGANDIVRVSVYGHPELSSPNYGSVQGTRIDQDGSLSLPLAGRVQVGGLTTAAALEAVSTAFAVYVKEPQVELSVIEYAARRVYVYGEVSRPGALVLDRPLNAYQALALSGGFTTRAWREEVILIRGSAGAPEVWRIQAETPSPTGFAPLRPDDLLFVRRSGAGRFTDELLPVLQGVSSSLASVATVLLIEEQL
jgi:protein involved in polysaccharide export with SLBB domain